MKTALITATLLVLAAAGTPSSAREIQSPVARQVYTCEAGGLSRVAMRPSPAPCCDGMLGCPQLLGNTGLVKPRRANRT